MDCLVTIQHPGHVHFFRHAIRALERDGHDVHVFCRDLEVVCDLLSHYDIEYEALAGGRGGFTSLAATQALYESRLLARALAIRPDVMTAIGGTAVAHVAALVDARSVVFTDTEHAPGNRITFPFADEVWTPDCYHGDVPGRHVTYPGYHELAYLHPDRFDPDPDVRNEVGVGDEPLVVLRVTAWDASHDRGQAGLDDVGDAIERLEATGATVLVTSEVSLPERFADRRVDLPPHRIHDLLATADLFVGEGATMAVESAVLGTPAVYVNTLRMGYTDEVESRYGLLFNCQGAYRHENALDTAVEVLNGDRGHDWDRRREHLLTEKRDTTAVVRAALTGDSPLRPPDDHTSPTPLTSGD